MDGEWEKQMHEKWKQSLPESEKDYYEDAADEDYFLENAEYAVKLSIEEADREIKKWNQRRQEHQAELERIIARIKLVHSFMCCQ